MTPQENRISVIDPIGPAIETVKVILFKPFDMGKWFVIGFCAWLAYLGGGGGFNFNFNPGTGGRQQGQQDFYQVKEYFLNNLSWIIPVAALIIILSIIIGIVLLWLRSRGRFMFLHCVAQNKAEVVNPWHKYKEQGNSLFLFRFVLGIISFVVFMLIFGMAALLFIMFGRGAAPFPAILFAIIFIILIAFPVGIFFGVISKFTKDFVVPIMYLHGFSCVDGWREFLRLASANRGRLALYILFQIVIAMAIGSIVFAAACVTCCCAACIFAIPYIGTVAMLPVLVFKRAYSLCYLRQYGAQYDTFRPEQSPPQPTQPQIQPGGDIEI